MNPQYVGSDPADIRIRFESRISLLFTVIDALAEVCALWTQSRLTIIFHFTWSCYKVILSSLASELFNYMFFALLSDWSLVHCRPNWFISHFLIARRIFPYRVQWRHVALGWLDVEFGRLQHPAMWHVALEWHDIEFARWQHPVARHTSMREAWLLS